LQLPVSSDGLFLSQPITTLENISYIFLAQAELKTQVYMENTTYYNTISWPCERITVLLVDCQVKVV